MEERKTWRLDHPHGFFARMAKNKDDSNNVFKWETGIPGKVGEDTIQQLGTTVPVVVAYMKEGDGVRRCLLMHCY